MAILDGGHMGVGRSQDMAGVLHGFSDDIFF
jgi:hypothetical protein